MSYTGRMPGIAPTPTQHYYPPLAWNIQMQVERYLPMPGEVLIAAGQRVESDAPVARTSLPGRPRLYNLAQFFEMSPKEVRKLMLKEINSRLAEDDLIAQKKGFRGKQFRAPFMSILSAYDEETAYLSLTPLPTPLVLEAYVRGIVSSTVPGYGVKIDLRANYVRGAIGIGGERHGVLRAMVTDPNQSITPDSIDARTTYFILLGGAMITAEALQKAVEMKVRGIITGSIREEELTKFLEYRRRESFYRVGKNGWRFPADINVADSPLTLVLTEGFGQRPMASRIFEMLTGQNGLEISINGTTRLRRGWQRPEIIAPVSSQLDAGRNPTDLSLTTRLPQPNALVRLINPTYLGVLARVISLPQRRHASSSASDRMVEVEVGGGRRLLLPAVDMEVIEQF